MKESILPKPKGVTHGFYAHLIAHENLRKNTCYLYNSLCEKIFQEKKQALFDISIANSYLNELIENKNGATSNYYFALKKWYKYYYQNKNDDVNYDKLNKPNTSFKKTTPNYLPLDRLKQRIKHIEPIQYRLCALIMLYGGARVSEVLSIQYKNIIIDEDGIEIIVDKSKTTGYSIYLTEKNYVYDKLINYLINNEFIDNDHLFCKDINSHDETDRQTYIETNRKYFSKELNDKVNIRTHDLKRNLAKALYDRGVQINKIKKLLHHKRIEVTEIYLEEIDTKKASLELEKI